LIDPSFFLWRALAASLFLQTACTDPTDWYQSSDNRPGQHSWLTEPYEQLRSKDLVLDDLARNVGRFREVVGETTDNRRLFVPLGSDVLLDQFGTVVMTGHQAKVAKNQSVVISLMNPRTGENHSFQALLEFVNEKLDIAFATIIDPAFSGAVKKGQFHALKWAQSRYGMDQKNTPVIFEGFPEDGHLLHAARGDLVKFDDSVSPYDYQTVYCKLNATGVVYHGMSGGPVFIDDGSEEFLGLINQGFSQSGGISYFYFTPSEVVYKLYKSAYPQRVQAGQFPTFSERDQPSSCEGKLSPISEGFDPINAESAGIGLILPFLPTNRLSLMMQYALPGI
jgi:hypothetical protein